MCSDNRLTSAISTDLAVDLCESVVWFTLSTHPMTSGRRRTRCAIELRGGCPLKSHHGLWMMPHQRACRRMNHCRSSIRARAFSLLRSEVCQLARERKAAKQFHGRTNLHLRLFQPRMSPTWGRDQRSRRIRGQGALPALPENDR
jgi:hypothetical protein